MKYKNLSEIYTFFEIYNVYTAFIYSFFTIYGSELSCRGEKMEEIDIDEELLLGTSEDSDYWDDEEAVDADDLEAFTAAYNRNFKTA